MSRFRAWMTAIAVAVAGGAALTVQLVVDKWQETNMTCADFADAAAKIPEAEEVAWLLRDQIIARCPQLASIVDCWKEQDGTLCRNGLHYGAGMGGHRDGVCVAFDPVTDDVIACQTDGGSAEAAVDPSRRSRREALARLRDKIERWHKQRGVL